MFFSIFQNAASARKKATAIVLISSDRGYLAACFEYKTASEQYLVAELEVKQFLVFFFKRKEIKIFFENTQNCFAHILAGKYRSDAVLYSKRTGGYSL